MDASVSDGSAATSHQELETLLAAEGAKDCRFDRHPVSVALEISLLEVANTPLDILPGPIPDNVFVEGLKVPGLVLGVKESRARQKLLLCFGSDGDRKRSLTHLQSVQLTSEPLFNSFSGRPCKPSLPLAIERRNTQAMLCYPVAEDHGGSLLPNTWKRQNPPAMVTVHVWNVAMDVLDTRVARSRDALEQHFKPFCQHAAIVLLTPTKDSSNVVTVSVTDKQSAEYLMKQASALSRFGYFKYVSSQEAVVEAPILVALREQRRNFYVKVQASEGEDLLTAKLVAEKARSRRVHTSILLRLLHQKQPWHLCLAAKDILYEDKPDRWLHLRQDSRSGRRQLVVPFHQSDESHFVMNRYWVAVENTLLRNGCKFHSSLPERDSMHRLGGIKLIVIESSSEHKLRKAKKEIDDLAARIGRRLVQRRIPLHMADLQLLLEYNIPYRDPRFYVRMPAQGYLDWLGLCHADVKLQVDGERARSVTIEACRFGNVRRASVDVLVVFLNWHMIPTSGFAAKVVRDGRSSVTEEMNAHYESGSDAQRGQPAALSSGCLNCKAIICSSFPGRHPKEPWSKLKEVLATCRQMGAKSIALAQAGYADSQTWLSALCKEVVEDVLTGGPLERVVTEVSGRSENITQLASRGLQTALRELRDSPWTGKHILSFNVVEDKPIAPPQRCYLPTTGVITAETAEDLDSAEEMMTAFLNAALQERVVPCSSVQCRRVVQCWRNCHMDMKLGCRLRLRNTNPHEITVRGPQSLLDSAVVSLEALIDKLIPTSDDSSTADLAELGTGSVDKPEAAGLAEQDRRSPESDLETSTSSEEDTDLSIVDFKYGRVRLRRVRGFVCGEYRTGKSSFIRATLGDEFIEGADSTPGVHVERTLVHFDPGRDCQAPFERIPGVAQLFVERVAELVHKKSQPDGSERSDEATPTVAGPVCGEVATAHFPQMSSTPINDHEALAELQCMVSAIALEDVGVGSHRAHGDEEPIATSDQFRFSTYPDDSLLWEFLPMESSEFKALESDRQEKIKAEVRAQLKKFQDLPQDKPVSRTYFEFWDCAGQMTMTTQQSICLDTTRSFFVLVFDASKDLDEEVSVEVYRQDGEDIEIPALFKGMTHRDFILMWLAVIAFRQQRSPPSSKQGQDAKIRETTVFLVGTHIDKVSDKDMDSTTSKINEEMKYFSSQARSANLELKGPYFVDNCRIQDAAVQDNQMVELQQDLVKTIESVEEEEMPLSWMKLEDALHLWQECKQSPERATSSISRHHMTFRLFSELAQYISKDGMTGADVEEALTFFHQLGSVICHDCDHLQKDSLIFLNAEWMLREFVKLLIFPLQKKNPPGQLSLEADLQGMREKGIVSAPILKAVWSDLDESVRKSIMATMCHFDLACRLSPATEPGDGAVVWSEDDGQSYFVPFCLTRGESKAELPMLHDEGDEGNDNQLRLPPLLLKFKTGFFPPPIYSRVAVHCANEFGTATGGVSMEHSAVVFSVETEKSVHDIRISWSPYGLKLEVCSSGEEKEVQTACANLLCAVDNCLEKLKNHQGYSGLSWHFAFPCAHETHCPMEAQGKPRAMTRLDNWIKIPANWYKTGATGRCDSCKKVSKVPPDVETYWLRNDPQAKVCSQDGTTTSVASGDSRRANCAQVPTMEQHGTAADCTTMALESETAGNTPKPFLPEAAANRRLPANNAIVVNCSAPAPAATTDLLDTAAYNKLRLELIETMDMGTARNAAECFSLITRQQQDDLGTVFEPKGRIPHNRELFRMMEVGGKSALRKFAAKVLSRLGPHFADRKERLELLLLA